MSTQAEAKLRPSRVDARAVEEAVAGTRTFQALQSAGEMGALALRTIRIAVTPPFPWVRDAIIATSTAFRRCAIPLAISHGVYVVGYGIILFGIVLTTLGVVEREAGAMFLIWSREIATWITAMVFAGVVGSAITADLAARKIREELDALSVLGIDQHRSLVVPRVVALTIAAPALAMLSLAFVQLVNYVVAPDHLGYSRGVFTDNVILNIYPLDIWLTMLVKNAVIGFFVGVVSCHKGLSSRGGAEGVGRAVNETVFITFFGIWLFNSFYNLAYMTLFPDVSLLKG